VSDPRGLGGLFFEEANPAPHSHRRRRRGRAAPLIAALVVVLVLAGAAAAALAGVHRLSHLFGGAADYSGQGSGRVVVAVSPGETADQVGQTLFADGVVASVAAFDDACNANSQCRFLAPGYYPLHHHMKASLALQLMLHGSSLGRVTIPEGYTVAAVLQRISLDSHIPLAQLQAAAADPQALGAPAYAGHHLEGFLFPDTYDVAPGMSAAQALSQMVAQFNQVAASINLNAGAAALHETPYDIVIIASIIQHEGVRQADFAKMARVFYNRLARGMPLGSDATLFYVLGPNHGPLTDSDLHLDSPYNTRIHTGLTPTPIDNPGEAALLAALHPASGTWLYFTTMDRKGDTNFETTYAQHEQDAAVAASRGIY
jgi:UPF0755 protein